MADELRVIMVDDEGPARRLLREYLEDIPGVSIVAECGNGFEAVKAVTEHEPDLLLLDIQMPKLDGFEVVELLERDLPIIFITGHGDVPMAVEAMQKGAVDFIQKPFRDQELLDRIREALTTDEERREEQQHHAEVAGRLERLTNREREVFDLVVTGKPNKVIAYELGVSQRTVEIHRARVMEKMQARSLADLVKMHMTA